MRVNCSIIRDLLPLYHDEVCSEHSRVLVEEHMRDCPTCEKELELLREEVNSPKVLLDESKPIKAIALVWKGEKAKAFAKGLGIAVALCAILFGAYFALTQWKIIPVSSDLLEISEVSQLEDGRIVYHLNVKDNKALHFVQFQTNADGSYYMTPMRSILEGERGMETGLFNNYFFVDVSENNAYQREHGKGIEIRSCYVGPQGDGILVWEKGMNLPAASEALENRLGIQESN